MKKISLILLATFAFFIVSCNNNTENSENKAETENKESAEKESASKESAKSSNATNPDLAKLSESSKNALDKSSNIICGCLKDHGSELQSFIDEVKPIMEEAKNSENPVEALSKMGGSMMKMRTFGECMDKADPAEAEEEKGALDKDFDAIMGDNDDRGARQMKQMEILSAFLHKNCPDNSKVFDDFIQFGSDMQEINKKR